MSTQPLKRILGITALIMLAAAAWGQVSNPSIVKVASDPTGNACTNPSPLQWYAGTYYGCDNTGHRAAIGGGGTVNSGTSGQLAYYSSTGAAVSGTTAIPNGTTATTQSPGNNSTKVATTAYVASPGAIAPTSVAVNGGSAITNNQGTDAYLQHSDGTGVSGYDAFYNTDGSTTKGYIDYGVCGPDILSIMCNLPDAATTFYLNAGSGGIHFSTSNAANTMSQGYSTDWLGDGTELDDDSGYGLTLTETTFTGQPLTGGISLQIGSTSDTGAISLDTDGTGPINLGANTINNYIANTYLLKLGSSTNVIDYGVTTAGTLTLLNPAIGSATATTQSPSDNSTKVATTAYVASPGAITPTTIAASGIISGGNDTTRTTTATMTNSFTSTGLVLPTVPVSTIKNGRCVVLWQMSSTSYTATFGFGMSNAPTYLWGAAKVIYAAAGSQNYLAFSQTATAPTAISTAATAGATGTTYEADVDFTLQTGSTNTVALTLYGETSNSGATLTIEPGSECHWLP